MRRHDHVKPTYHEARTLLDSALLKSWSFSVSVRPSTTCTTITEFQCYSEVTLHISDHQYVSFIVRHCTRKGFTFINLLTSSKSTGLGYATFTYQMALKFGNVASSVSHFRVHVGKRSLHSTILISNLTWNRFQLPGLAFQQRWCVKDVKVD